MRAIRITYWHHESGLSELTIKAGAWFKTYRYMLRHGFEIKQRELIDYE